MSAIVLRMIISTFLLELPLIAASHATTLVGCKQSFEGSHSHTPVVVLRQVHAFQVFARNGPGHIASAEENELVSRSQFSIMHYLIAHPDAEVFMEGLSKPFVSKELASDVQSVEYAKRLFPSGIPSDYEKLNSSQKSALARYPSPYFLGYLGCLEQIHPTLTKEARDHIVSVMTRHEAAGTYAEGLKQLKDLQEKEAITAIDRFLQERPRFDREIVLIFGASHEFKEASQAYPHLSLKFVKTVPE